jgi:CubicO group peptidase (beta-lactamase class C family)
MFALATPSLAQTKAPAPKPARPPAQTTQAGPRDVSALLAPIIKQADIPGMAAAVIEHDRVVAIGCSGVRERGKSDAITASDQFHLGSDTKAMTATLIAMLVEEGKLKWTTTVGESFTDIPMDPHWKPITLEQLLWHRGGVPMDLSEDWLWEHLWQFKGTPTEARMALVTGVLKHPPKFPGKYSYANGGYAMAGAMAERVTGRSWEDLMREKLFVPLGMTSAGFGAPGTKDAIDEPRGHKEDGTPVEPGPGADNPVAIGPAGIVHCTISDWAKFVILHLRGDLGDAKLIKPESFKKLHEPGPGLEERYAMGWLVPTRPWAKGPGGKGTVLTHAGSNTLWYCVVWIAPERDFAVLVACNQGGKKAASACDVAASAMIEQFETNKAAKGESPTKQKH